VAPGKAISKGYALELIKKGGVVPHSASFCTERKRFSALPDICSYDTFAVPDPSFVLNDTVGGMYFCNLRCFGVWSMGLATRPNLSEEAKSDTYTLTTPSGEQHRFIGIVNVTRWATTTAFEEKHTASETA